MKRLLTGVMLIALAATPVAAQPVANATVIQPRLTNGQIESHVVSGSLTRDVQALASRLTAPAWVGYAVPMVAGDRQMCDWNGSSRSLSPPVGPVHLEPPAVFLVLLRVEAGQVVRIRSYSVDCPLDGGGRSVHWFAPVTTADSLALLATFIAAPGAGKLAEHATSAIALHDGAAALDTLIGLARNDHRRKVRGDALFWLGQRAGEKAVGAISAAIDSDPDTQVKKKAVFALSQLPNSEGVPLLIEQARTNRNAAVRKQAMFWLGQSNDPRALRYFEEVLR